MRLSLNKEWFLIEREDYANYLFVVATWEGYTRVPRAWGFPVGRYLGAEYIDSACNLFALKEPLDNANQVNFQMLFTKPERWDALHRLTIRNARALFTLGRRLQALRAERLSNIQLTRAIHRFQEGQVGVHDPRGPMWLLETPNNLVSDYLHKYLAEKAEQARVKTTPFEAFRILSAPLHQSLWTKEKEDLIRIGLIRHQKERDRRLAMHTKQYAWLEYGLQGKILDHGYFAAELQKVEQQGLAKALRQIQQEPRILAQQQKRVIKEYKIHPHHQRIFRIVQDSFYTRLLSKDSQFFGYYCIEPLLREVGRRGYLTLEQVRFLAPSDYEHILLQGKDLSRLAEERRKYSIHISDGAQTQFFIGDEARKMRKKMKFFKAKEVHGNAEELRGQPAYSGSVTGRVKIVNTIPEMAKMHPGNILVSHMTNPGIVPAMKQAGAIVTDLGGITCHAAIVARELKKPCIIGTKVATKVLKDGDMVEVDADKGIVRRLS